MDSLHRFLPAVASLQLTAWQFDDTERQLTLMVTSLPAAARCPLCQKATRRVDSAYHRTVADRPWGDYRVTLYLKVRKFFCREATCQRRVFTERLPGLVAPWARRTERLTQQLAMLGVALGGQAGERLSQHLGLRVSHDTLLRSVRRTPWPPTASPTVLGVDDFAFRRRQRYGTVLVDLERHRPVALLTDREASTLAQWLKAHPGVKVIARDRWRAYINGAAEGAPQAVQVADRFHLLQNLATALERVFSAHAHRLKALPTVAAPALPPAPTHASAVTPVLPAPPPPARQVRAAAVQTARRARWEKVWALRHQGWTMQAIASQVGLDVTTGCRYLQQARYQPYQPSGGRGRSLLNPYKAYLIERWNNGCHHAGQLYRDLKQQGYPGSYTTLANYARQLRHAQGLRPWQRTSPRPLPVVVEPGPSNLTPRQATWLILKRPRQQETADTQQIAHLKAQHPAVAAAINLAQTFATVVRNQHAEQLNAWLEQAAKSTLAPFRNLAASFSQDAAAIHAALTLPWSTGPVEGHIHRLKLVKRQSYGRASMELLSRRFLLAA